MEEYGGHGAALKFCDLDDRVVSQKLQQCGDPPPDLGRTDHGTRHAAHQRMVHDYQVTGLVIGCAIDVHKALGPGLKEKAYTAALCEALERRNVLYASERAWPVRFAGVNVGSYRPDLIVENTVVVEVKAVDRLIPLFTSQLVTYLRITQLRVGLLLNFNCPKMSQGIKRVVL